MKSDSAFPALLLAGGFGTRLRSVVPNLPKPLAPVNGRPFITYLLDQLAEAGFTRAILCLHHQAHQVVDKLGTTYGPLALDYSIEAEPLGTGGAVRLALAKINAPRFLLLNADSFCRVSLRDFIAFHRAHDDPASLVSVQVEDTARYGGLRLSAEGRIIAFSEKDGLHHPGTINGGIYLLETTLAETIPVERPVSLEHEMFPRWIDRGFRAWTTSSPFIDIGVPESYALAQTLF
jgi:NDP-sugar pyrophosphorylase family protein